MRVLVYEFVTGGGWFHVAPHELPSSSLLSEGSAMLRAVVDDFLRLPDCRVVLLRDARLAAKLSFSSDVEVHVVASADEARAMFSAVLQTIDAVLPIAPEFAGYLLSCLREVMNAGKQLLSPGVEFTTISSDKALTYARLRDANIPTPRTWSIRRDEPLLAELPVPFVVKPLDGCGSMGVRKYDSREVAIDWSEASDDLLLAQEFVAGRAASIAVIAGRKQSVFLPGCFQHLSDDGRFTYLGGETPIGPSLQERAERLARRVVAAMPPCNGYFGIDLVLGEADDGSSDYVIEINPRLTTSYVGLLQLCEKNLAAAMIDAATGRPMELTWRNETIRFRADGVIH